MQLRLEVSHSTQQTQSGTDPCQNFGSNLKGGCECFNVSVSSHLWVLLVLEVLVDGGVEVLGVALIKTVDLPLLLDLHVPLNQDELTDGLRDTNITLKWDNPRWSMTQDCIH